MHHLERAPHCHVFGHGMHIAGHDFGHRDVLRIEPLGDHPADDVPLGNDSDELPFVEHDDRARRFGSHRLRHHPHRCPRMRRDDTPNEFFYYIHNPSSHVSEVLPNEHSVARRMLRLQLGLTRRQ